MVLNKSESETCMSISLAYSVPAPADGRSTDFERPVDVKTAARFLGISPSLVYAYVASAYELGRAIDGQSAVVAPRDRYPL